MWTDSAELTSCVDITVTSGWCHIKSVYYDMGLVARKPVFRCLRTTKTQTSLRIPVVWSAPLLFAFWKAPYLSLLKTKFNFLDSLCSWGDWFESRFVGNPEDRFSHDEAHIYSIFVLFFKTSCTGILKSLSNFSKPQLYKTDTLPAHFAS